VTTELFYRKAVKVAVFLSSMERKRRHIRVV